MLMSYALRSAMAALVLILAAVAGAPAQGQRQAGGPPASLDAVRARIDLGGSFFVFIDYEDQIARLGRDLTTAIADAVGDDPELAILRQDYAAIFEEIGISGIKAVGMSSTRTGPGGYLNRSFVHAPEPRRGLLAALGGPARPFSTTRLAPADTDFFVETEIDMPALVRAATAIARRFAPDAGIDAAADALADRAGPEAAEAMAMAAALRGRITLALRLGVTPTPHAQILEEWPLELLRNGGFLLRIEGLGPTLAPMLREFPLLAPATVAGRIAFRAAEAIPILGDNQPVLVIDGDALIVGSSATFVAQSLARASGLGDSPGFVQAIGQVGLAEGNTLVYTSPRLFRVLRELLGAAVQFAGDRVPAREMLPLIEAVIAQIPAPEAPTITVSANLPDGILTQSIDAMSQRGALMALSLYNPELIAPLVLSVVPAAIRAEADRRGELRAAEITEANLRLIGEAALAWFDANPGASQVGYAELEPRLAGRLGRVRDIDFTDFLLDRGFGKIELELPNGDVVVWYAPMGEPERERIRANLRAFDRAAAWYFRTNPAEMVMLGAEAIEDGSPMASLPVPVRGERYEDLRIRRTDSEIAIEAAGETIAVARDPALLRQQTPLRRQQPRGG